jgi:hypothetical protein
MSDYRDLLERERRRHTMPDGSLEGLQRRRDRKRRNSQIAVGILALLIAAAGVGGGLFALQRSTGPKPAGQTPTPTPTPAAGGQVGPSPVSGPIQFIDEQQGWMVFRGRIFVTAEGGRSWTPQYSGPLTVHGVAFVDASHGWAVSAGGLLRTVDGGAHWDPLDESGVGFDEVQFQDARVGWGIRLDFGPDSQPAGTVVKTTDAGLTWVDLGFQADSICSGTDSNDTSVWVARDISLRRSTDGGRSWTGGPLAEFTRDEPWTASVRCAPNADEAFVLLQDGGAAGHIAYVAYQATSDGQGGYKIQFVLQEGGTHPLGQDYGSVYNSEDPYPGPFTVVTAKVAYFMNWCPQCQAPTLHLTKAAGNPPDVTDRFPVPAGDQPTQALGLSFLTEDHGWAVLEESELVVVETRDGGRTWRHPCGFESTPCI